MNMKPFGGSSPIEIHDCGVGLISQELDETWYTCNYGGQGQVAVLE